MIPSKSKFVAIVQLLSVIAAVALIIHAAETYKAERQKELFSESMKWATEECRKAGMKSAVMPAYDGLNVFCVPKKK